MFFILSKILAFLIKPTFWIFILLISSIVFKKKRKRLIILTLLTFYFFTNSFIVDEFSRHWEIDRYIPTDNYDVGIVLGGIADYDSQTEAHNFNSHADRLMEAEQLYHKKIIDKIMLSGGNGSLYNNGYVEANEMKKYLINKNIPSEDILIENKSRNTKENASNSAEILNKRYKNGNFLLITSASHMRRAMMCFKKSELKVTPFPTDCTKSSRSIGVMYILSPRIEALDQWETLIKEWVGYIVYSIAF